MRNEWFESIYIYVFVCMVLFDFYGNIFVFISLNISEGDGMLLLFEIFTTL